MTAAASDRLRVYMNWLALEGTSVGRSSSPLCGIRDAGYDGVQFTEPLSRALVDEACGLELGICGSGRVNEPEDAGRLAKEARDAGLECLTLHVGWGIEDDHSADQLIVAVLEASMRYAIPLYVETHRATIFQDMWRTVQFVHRFPSLRFNGDFSHWYTGAEMVYGGFARKLEFIQPVLERVRFLHGRIGNPGCMQVDIANGEVDGQPAAARRRGRVVVHAFVGLGAGGAAISACAPSASPAPTGHGSPGRPRPARRRAARDSH